MPLKTGHDLSSERIAAGYAAIGAAGIWPEEFYWRVLALAGDLRGRRLAEIGCGRGGLLAAAAGRGALVHGADLTASHAAAARNRAPSAGIVVADVLDGLPYRTGAFDVVVAMEVIEHLRDPAECFVEARRLLKQGGMLMLTVPNATAYAPFHVLGRLVPGRWLRRKLLPYEHPVNTRQPIDTMYAFGEILQLVADNGFRADAVDGYRHFRWAYGFPVIRTLYTPLAPRVERWLRGRNSHRFAYHLIVRARPV